jgi:hypothetical protein
MRYCEAGCGEGDEALGQLFPADGVGEFIETAVRACPLLEAGEDLLDPALVERVGLDSARSLEDDGVAVLKHIVIYNKCREWKFI